MIGPLTIPIIVSMWPLAVQALCDGSMQWSGIILPYPLRRIPMILPGGWRAALDLAPRQAYVPDCGACEAIRQSRTSTLMKEPWAVPSLAVPVRRI